MNAKFLVTALLLSNVAPAVSAELGRLFFTPAQRETLDSARAKNVRVEIDSENPQPAAAPMPQNVSVNGLVRRSDGANTVWLNNSPVSERQSTGLGIAPSARRDNRVRLTVTGEKRSIDLKVGQSAEILSGAVEEGYALRRAARQPDTNPATGAANATTADGKSAPLPATPPAAPPGAAQKDEARNMEPGAQGLPRRSDAQPK